MPQPVPIDFLVISDTTSIPLAALADALTKLRLGAIDAPTPTEEDLVPRPGLERVVAGRIAIHETLARADARLVFERHAHPVMRGLGPASLDRLSSGLDPTREHQFRSGTLSVDIHINAADADRAWCLAWSMAIVDRVVTILNGVALDLAAQRCLGPEGIARLKDGEAIGHVTLHNEPWGPETVWLHTHGLQKFGQPELEIVDLPQPLETEGSNVLRAVAETLIASDGLDGPTLRAGMEVDVEGAGYLLARPTQPNSDHQARFGRLRLVTAPTYGHDLGNDATEATIVAALHTAQVAIDSRAWPTALRHLDRVLVAVPDHPAALATKARYFLAQGQPTEALEVGMLLSLRAPNDYRSPYTCGLALMALGRFVEALDDFNQATAHQPDDPDPFDSRARLYERLGRTQDAASDRARAAMLRG